MLGLVIHEGFILFVFMAVAHRSSRRAALTLVGSAGSTELCIPESPSLVLDNDETLVLTSILSVCRLNEVGTCQVMKQVMIMVMKVMTTR